jgi:hypothetical protein
MAAPNYTPIQLYRTNTASTTAPDAANLNAGELAINYNDAGMALYAKNTSGTVKKLINNPAGLTYPAADGSAYQVIQTNGSGTMSFAPSASSVLTSQGDLLYASGANTLARLAKSTSATRYLSNTGTSNNPAWAQIDLTNGVTGTLPYGNGGTGVSAAATNGQLLIGNGSGFTLANITVSPPLSISNTAGGIALSASGLGTGDVIGPTGATDRALAIYDGATGKILQNSTATLTSAGFLTANGLTFPASVVLSSDPNTLDDYEEGTFTPTFTSTFIQLGDIVVTYSAGTQKGFYVKIGRTVFFSVFLATNTVTVVGSTGTALSMAGLPFEVGSTLGMYTYVSVDNGYFWNTNAPSWFYPTAGTTEASLGYKTAPNSTSMNPLLDSSLSTTGTGRNNLSVQGFYITNV